jgi:hypothetical protein
MKPVAVEQPAMSSSALSADAKFMKEAADGWNGQVGIWAEPRSLLFVPERSSLTASLKQELNAAFWTSMNRPKKEFRRWL